MKISFKQSLLLGSALLFLSLIFGYTGNLLAPGNIITPTNFVGTNLRTNLGDYNWSASITNIATGVSTVVTLANNIFGDPWEGQVTITDVGGATEANATWWYRAADVDALELFTDNTFTTPVDSSAWGTYTGGGVAGTFTSIFKIAPPFKGLLFRARQYLVE